MAIEFPQWVIDRVVTRQGRLHAYERIDPCRTAFVVIDLQNYFMLPGYQGECAASRATIPVVNRLANALRAAGGTVIWVQTTADGADVFWSHHHRDMLTPERSRRRLKELASDSPGFALHRATGRQAGRSARREALLQRAVARFLRSCRGAGRRAASTRS